MKLAVLNFPFSRWQFILTAIVGYVALTIAYGIGWHHLPWDDDIIWNEQLFGSYSKQVLYALEFITISIVLLFAVALKNTVAGSIDPSGGRSAIIEKSMMLAALLLIVVHATVAARTEWDTLSQYYKSWWLLAAVRYFYALFCCCVVALWLRLSRGLFDLYYPSLKQDLQAVQETPQKVFNVGRRLARKSSLASLLCIAAILPIFTWLPTLVPTTLKPYFLAAAIGAFAALGSISIPIYIQHRLSDAIFRTLESMDSYIESRLPNIDEVAKDPSPLNDMIELRENLAKSLRLPGNVIAVITVQILAAVGMIVGIVNGLLKWGG